MANSSFGFGFSPYVFGGEEVKDDDEIVQFTVSMVDDDGNFLCSASIIAHDVALTAAHCIYRETNNLRFGLNARNTEASTIATEKILVHPDYKSVPDGEGVISQNDIALIYFQSELAEGFRLVNMLRDVEMIRAGDELIESLPWTNHRVQVFVMAIPVDPFSLISQVS